MISHRIASFVAAFSLMIGAAGSEAAPVRTPFDPTKHGFQFVNSFKNDFIREFDIRTGGLCGGMVYSSLDYYLAKMPIPMQDYRPAVNTRLHDYIYNRQVHSIADNLDKWTEIGFNPLGARNSEFFKWGLQGYGGGRLQELREKIDRGTPVPLGMQEVGGGGPGNHQILAIGYDLGRYRGDLKDHQADLKIYVYDPNVPGQTRTLVPDIKGECYYYLEDSFCRWRTYFVDKKYKQHKPPAFPSSAPTPKDGLVRELILEIRTGGDDLRGGNDNVHATINFRTGAPQKELNINGRRRWIDNYMQTVSILLKRPVPVAEIARVDLTTTFGGGIGGDNWNIDSFKVTARGGGVNQILHQSSGTPLFRFTGDRQNFSVTTR